MSKQTEFDFKAAAHLRNKGMQKAVDHADYVTPKWSEKAYNFLKDFIKTKKEFMVEEMRSAAKDVLEAPPSNRAWGAIVVKACKAGLIKRVGYRPTKNKKAHRTPATVWGVVNL